jgi:hypothetical protein
VPWAPSIETAVVGPAVVEPGTCVSDALDVSGWNPEVEEVVVDTLLVGPFAELPAEGTDLGDVRELEEDGLVAGRVSTTLTDDGRVETPCTTADEVGAYVFVYTSEGTPAGPDGDQVVPAFADTRVHAAESFRVEAPAVATPPVVPPATTPVLAFTGPGQGGLALGIVSAGALILAGLGTVHVVRRRRGESDGPA